MKYLKLVRYKLDYYYYHLREQFNDYTIHVTHRCTVQRWLLIVNNKITVCSTMVHGEQFATDLVMSKFSVKQQYTNCLG